MMDSEQLKKLLHKRALKATSNRLNLLLVMQAYQSAMPYSAIQKAMNPIDRVTLYRTLESLTANGIIHKAYQENNEIFYAICGTNCGSDHHHHDHVHFKCLNCKAVTCENPAQNIEISLPDFEIYKISIHLEGLCKICRKNAS